MRELLFPFLCFAELSFVEATLSGPCLLETSGQLEDSPPDGRCGLFLSQGPRRGLPRLFLSLHLTRA